MDCKQGTQKPFEQYAEWLWKLFYEYCNQETHSLFFFTWIASFNQQHSVF
jgi:hypothetical protein